MKIVQYLLPTVLAVLCLVQVSQAQNDFNDIEVINFSTDVKFLVNFTQEGALTIGGDQQQNTSNETADFWLSDYTNQSEVHIFANQLDWVGEGYAALNVNAYSGEYAYNQTINNLKAEFGESFQKIDVTWDMISGADGYLVYRSDYSMTEPFANIQGAHNNFLEDSYVIYSEMLGNMPTYYVMAYNISNPTDRFITPAASVLSEDNTTQFFTFNAITIPGHEAVVTFDWSFANAAITDSDFDQIFMEIVDQNDRKVHERTYAFSDLVSQLEIDLDTAIQFTGGQYLNNIYYYGNTWTVEFWLNSSRGTNQYLSYVDDNSYIMYDNDELVIKSAQGEVRVPNITTEEWVHLALAYDGTTLKVYEDGELIHTDLEDLSFPVRYVGAKNGTTGFWRGELAMIRSWVSERTQLQIKSDRTNVYEVSPSDLNDQWIFETENQSTIQGLGYESINYLTHDAANHPLTWNEIFNFNGDLVTDIFTHYEQPYSTNTYTLNMYEFGSGRLIFSKNAQVTLENSISTSKFEGTVSDNQIELAFMPGSIYADEYQLWRSTYHNDELKDSIQLETLAPNQIQHTMSFEGDRQVSLTSSIPVGWQSRDWNFATYFKFEETGTTQTLVGARMYTQWARFIVKITPDNKIQLVNDNFGRTFDTYVDPEVWHSLIITYDRTSTTVERGNAVIYLDGEVIGTVINRGMSMEPAQLGGDEVYTNGDYLKGEIAYAGVLVRNALSEDEVLASYKSVPSTLNGWNLIYADEEGVKRLVANTSVEPIASFNEVLLKSTDEASVQTNFNLNLANDGIISKPISYVDAFTKDDDLSILGGYDYAYQIVPLYKKVAHLDTMHAEAVSVASRDMNVLAVELNDTLQVTWDLASFDDSTIDTVYISRDGEIIDRVIGESIYHDVRFTYGDQHVYGVHPIKHGEIFYAQFDTAQHATNGQIAGYFLSDHDIIVRNATQTLTTTIDEVDYSESLSSDTLGAFLKSGIYYENQATFTWPKGETVQLNVYEPEQNGIFVQVDTSFEHLEAQLIDTLYSSTLSNKTVQLHWTSTSTENLFINVYRDEVLIAVLNNQYSFVDSFGVHGTTHEYLLRAYYFSATGEQVYIHNTSIEADYPNMSGIGNFSVRTVDFIPVITWDFPFTTLIDRFEVYRDDYLLASISEKSNGPTFFEVADTLGVPDSTYQYRVEVYGLNQEIATTEQTDYTYPLPISWINLEWEAGMYGSLGHEVFSTEVVNVPVTNSWDGILMLNEEGKVMSALQEGTSGRFIGPMLNGKTHLYTLHGYKNTDYGQYIGAELQDLGIDINESYALNADELISGVGFTKVKWKYATDAIIPNAYQISDDRQNTEAQLVPNQLNSWVLFHQNYFNTQINIQVEDAAGNAFTTSVSQPANWTSGLQDPMNFVASDGTDGYVFLSWEYPTAYSHATFEIWRDGTKIADIDKGIAAYLDADANLNTNEAYAYQIRALYNGDSSRFVGDIGYINYHQAIEGFALDQNGFGIPNVYLTIGNQQTKTDSAGYYRFDALNLAVNDQVTITYSLVQANLQGQQLTFTITDQQEVYQQDISINVEQPRNQIARSAVTELFALSVTPDPIDWTTELRWQPMTDHYSGFEIYEGIAKVATYTRADGLVYTDNSGFANFSYSYSVVPFYTNRLGQITYGEGLVVESEYPLLASPTHFVASPVEAEGRVVLNWSHPTNLVDGYLILRDDELVADIPASDLPVYYDETGVSGQLYHYKLYAYRKRDGGTIVSDEYLTSNAEFPATAEVATFQIVDERANNRVLLSWSHPEIGQYDGVAIYRGNDQDDLVGTFGLEETSCYDSLGIPNLHTVYTARTYREIDGVKYQSAGAVQEIVFPALAQPSSITADNSKIDTLTFSWDYPAGVIDYFRVEITGPSGLGVDLDRSLEIPFEHGKTTYEVVLTGGAAGKSYRTTVYAIDERKGEAYESTGYVSTGSFQALPQPHSGTFAHASGSAFNTFNWEYDNQSIDGFNLTISDGNTQLVSTVLAPAKRSYTYIPEQDLSGKKIKFQVNAFQNLSNTSSASYSDSVSFGGIQYNNATYMLSHGVVNLSATTNVSAGVKLAFNFDEYHADLVDNVNYPYNTNITPRATINITELDYVIKRDGEVIFEGDEYAMDDWDYDAIDNQEHVYEAFVHAKLQVDAQWYFEGQLVGEASFTDEAFHYDVAIGKRLGSGQISGSVLSTALEGIPNVDIRLIGRFRQDYHIDTVSTDGNGEFIFKNVPYSSEDVEYTVQPINSTGTYDPASASTFLNENTTNAFLEAFIDQTSYVVKGDISYFCNECIIDEPMLVTLYAYDEYDNEVTATSGTTEGGAYALAFFPDNQIERVEIELDPTQGSAESADETNSWRYGFETLKHEISYVDIVTAEEYVQHFDDTTQIPVKYFVGTVCGPITGYQFKVKFDAEGSDPDTVIYTNTNGQINALLPPYNYTTHVLGVDKLDNFSQTVLDYFRSRELKVSLADKYSAYSDSVELDDSYDFVNHFDELYQQTYHTAPDITVSGFENYYACDDVDYPVIQGTVSRVSVNFEITEAFGSDECRVNEGYVVIKNPGATVGTDTVHYNPNRGTFDTYTFEPGLPNLVAPYLHLMEANYYGADQDYKGTAVQAFIVTGQAQVPGTDVLVNPDFGESQKPLFILRDPPGDKSYSYIEDGTTMSFEFNTSQSDYTITDGNFKFYAQVLGPFAEVNTNYNFTDKYAKSNQATLNLSFTQSISTASESKLSTNLKGYLDGRDANIIGGMGVVLAYGLAENLEFNSNTCEFIKSPTIDISANEITSTWYYTTSQIEQTIRYYEQLLEQIEAGAEVKFDGSQTPVTNDDGKVFDQDYLRDWLDVSILDWKEVLDYMDVESTPPCVLCSQTTYESNALTKFCEQYVWNANSECDGETLKIEDWSDETMETYREEYYKFIAKFYRKQFAEYEQYVKADPGSAIDGAIIDQHYSNLEKNTGILTIGDLLTDTDLAEVNIFSPIENYTYSGGVTLQNEYVREEMKSLVEDAYFESSFQIGLAGGILLKYEAGANFFGFHWNKAFSLLDIRKDIKSGGKDAWQITNKDAESQSFKFGYVLSDDDDGDHFNVSVMHDPYNTVSSLTPYFYLIGGRSSCPFEEGTITRDAPEIALVNDEGTPYQTIYHDLDPNEPVILPLQIHSGNLFDEDRIISISVLQGTNVGGAEIKIEGQRVHAGRSADMFVPANSEVYTNLNILPEVGIYDYEIGFIARPQCVNSDYWANDDNGEGVFDTLYIELHYRKPTSPIEISEHNGSWKIFEDNQRNPFYLTRYSVDDISFSLNRVIMEYKPTESDQSNWTRMQDTEGYEELSLDFLKGYHKQNIATYPEPTYPFIWDVSEFSLEALPDGDYDVRASVYGDNGGISYSNVSTGVIERTPPEVESYAPADSVFSDGDSVSLRFSENMRAESYDNSLLIVEDAVTGKQYQIAAELSGSSLDLFMDDEVIAETRGRKLRATLSKEVEDLFGKTLETAFTWEFEVDVNASLNPEAAFKAVAFPNPSDGNQMNLRFIAPDSEEPMQVQVLNLEGKSVYQELFDPKTDLKASTLTLDFKQTLQSGLYIVVITQGERADQVKVMVE
ncbi:MAG: LamG-like jellyroll fold domain-containing protein [Flammeovirgaceae bacterium]